MTRLDDTQLKQHLSDGQYEFVDVTFQAADTETVIPYTILTPEDPEEVRWLDVTPGSDASNVPAHVYRSGAPSRLAWNTGYIVLSSTLASYSTRLKLFVERS
jgi:hypothetical protein